MGEFCQQTFAICDIRNNVTQESIKLGKTKQLYLGNSRNLRFNICTKFVFWVVKQTTCIVSNDNRFSSSHILRSSQICAYSNDFCSTESALQNGPQQWSLCLQYSITNPRSPPRHVFGVRAFLTMRPTDNASYTLMRMGKPFFLFL